MRQRVLKDALNIIGSLECDVVILNQYFCPDTAATAMRIMDICEKISTEWRVVVVCGTPSYNPKPLEMKMDQLKSAIYVIRIPGFRCSRKNVLGRIVNYMSYLLGAFIVVSKVKVKGCFLTFTDPPLVGLIGMVWAKIKGKPYLQVVQDLHPECSIASGLLRDGAVSRIITMLTSLYLKNADVVVAIGERMKEYLAETRKVPESRIRVIHNWPENLFPEGKKLNLTGEMNDRDASLKVLYAGNLGYSQGLEVIVECAQRLELYSDIEFVIIGEGASKERLVNLVIDKSLTNIKFGERISGREFSNMIRSCHVGLVLMKDGLKGAMVPSKLYTIMAASIPFLCVGGVESDVDRIGKTYFAGTVVPHDAQEMAEAILWFRGHPEEREKMGRNGRLAVEKDFGTEHGVKRYARLIEEVCAHS